MDVNVNKIQVIDDEGNELIFDVLFTFDNEDTGKKYVLYYDPTLEEPQVYSSIYDDEGHLFPVETPEEWEMVEELFNSFLAEDEEADECDHQGCCHDNDDHECCHENDDHECCCQNKSN